MLRIVDARPEPLRVDPIAAASYTTALAAHEAGRPSAEVYAILRAFGRYRLAWDAKRTASLFEDER